MNKVSGGVRNMILLLDQNEMNLVYACMSQIIVELSMMPYMCIIVNGNLLVLTVQEGLRMDTRMKIYKGWNSVEIENWVFTELVFWYILRNCTGWN